MDSDDDLKDKFPVELVKESEVKMDDIIPDQTEPAPDKKQTKEDIFLNTMDDMKKKENDIRKEEKEYLDNILNEFSESFSVKPKEIIHIKNDIQDKIIKTINNKNYDDTEKNKILTDIYMSLNDEYSNPLPKQISDELRRQIIYDRIKYGIYNKKGDVLEEFIIPPENKQSNIIARGLKMSDKPGLIQNNTDFNKLKNYYKKIDKQIKLKNPSSVKDLKKKLQNSKILDLDEELVLNFLKKQGTLNSNLNNIIKNIQSAYQNLDIKLIPQRTNMFKSIENVENLLKKYKQYDSMVNFQLKNINEPVKQNKKNVLDADKLLQGINTLNKVKVHKRRPVFKSGFKKDIVKNFEINRIQIAQFKSGVIEVHVLPQHLKESDLKVLSHFICRTTGKLYNDNKKFLGTVRTYHSTMNLIRKNIDFNKNINVFYVIPETKKGGSLNDIHGSIRFHNLLRRIL